LKGYKAAFGSNVRFVLTGHSEVSQSTLGRWFLVHSVVITLGIVGRLVAPGDDASPCRTWSKQHRHRLFRERPRGAAITGPACPEMAT